MPTTRACRLTAELPAAIATIAIAGCKAVQMVESNCQLACRELKVGRVHYGKWRLPPSASGASAASPAEVPVAGSTAAAAIPMEEVVLCRTAADMIEVHCHGGTAICAAILRSLENLGCEIVATEHWSWSASPLRQQAQQDLMLATTDQAAAILLDQANGALELAIEKIVILLRSDKVDLAEVCIRQLLRWKTLGLHLARPWRIVLAGPPNVGKSSMTNAIVGRHAAIVHREAGTTRDFIEAETAIGGWPVVITDTAGIRDSHDAIETEGVRRAQQQLELADLTILLVDSTIGWTTQHDRIFSRLHGPALLCLNKVDLLSSDSVHVALPEAVVSTLAVVRASCQADGGIESLLQAVQREIVPQRPGELEPVPFRASHIESLERAEQLLSDGDAAAGLEEILLLAPSWIGPRHSP